MRHLKEVVLSFLEYSLYSKLEVDRRWSHLCMLTPQQARLLPSASLGPKMEALREAIAHNQVRSGTCIYLGMRRTDQIRSDQWSIHW